MHTDNPSTNLQTADHQAADRSLLVLLAHHLHQAGLVQLPTLAAELQHIGMARLEPGWQLAHEALAQALAQGSGVPRGQCRAARRR